MTKIDLYTKLGVNTNKAILIKVLPSSQSLAKSIQELADNGGGLIIIGYVEADNYIINQREFYCEKISAKAKMLIDQDIFILPQRKLVGNKELFVIAVSESNNYKESICEVIDVQLIDN